MQNYMKKTYSILFSLLTILLLNNVNVSQTKFNVIITGGYSLPAADLRGDYPDTLSSGLLNFTKAGTLLTKGGFNIGLTGKYTVDTTGKARVTVSLTNNSLSGSQDYSRPNGVLSYKNKVNIFSVSAGIEYNIFPKKKFSPFVGLDISANFFSGKIEGSGDTIQIVNRKSESRIGVTVNGGVDIKLNNSINLVAGVKYVMANLIGKKTDITTTTSTISDAEEEGTGLLYELPLNDEETSSNRGKVLNFLQFYTGISLNFGEFIK